VSERILYFDCFSGLAGDMTLGGLIDLGVDPVGLEAALRTLDLGEWRLHVGASRKMGLRGVHVRVVIGGVVEEAAVPAPEGGHAHGHDHDHDHDHDHVHDHDHGPHGHRSYREIVDLIAAGGLPGPVVERALAAFRVIGEAEARVHGVDLEQVHFHEVGAVDSIVDIVGAAWGIWQLGVDRIEAAPPPIGRGFIRVAHGRMPCPAPATLEILRGVAIAPAGLDRELVTPTGASFVRAWAARVGGYPAMTVEGVGFGAGNADFPDRPNLLRLVLGRTDAAEAECTVVEANVDDMTPEIAGYLLERLFEAGAKDAWFVPVHMKKNRPGIIVGALCDAGTRVAVEEILLAESSAIGLRRFPVTRLKLDRVFVEVQTPFGAVPVKVARRDGRTVNAAPEYEACARLARECGVPLKVVYQHAIAAWLARGPAEES
jgi:uncharacterized protein (TIGR00299 family) protein